MYAVYHKEKLEKKDLFIFPLPKVKLQVHSDKLFNVCYEQILWQMPWS